jgi:uncharacterized protein
MALARFLLDLLEDPVDHGPLLYVASASVLYNPRTRKIYEVRDSIPVMLPDEAREASESEHQSLTSAPDAVFTGRQS